MMTRHWRRARQTLVGREPLTAGLMAGGLGLVVSFALKGLIPARPLGDPIPLILAVTQIPRGFTYLPWQPAVYHLVFAMALGVLAFVILWLVSGQFPGNEQAAFAGRVAGSVSVSVVAILAIDAVIVGFWYLMAGLVSVLVCGFAAGLLAARRPAQSPGGGKDKINSGG